MARPRAGIAVRGATLLVALFFLLPTAALAQAMSGGNLAQLVMIDVRDGHEHEFQEGLKRHMTVAEEQGNPSAWMVFETMTGENTGTFMAGTFGHEWADFDMTPADPQAAEMSFMTNVQPHVKSAQVSFWTLRPDLSTADPSADTDGPSRFAQVFHYMPTPAGAMTAEQAFARVTEMATAAEWPGKWMVYQLVNGGPGPHYVVVIEAESFADMAEPSPSMFEMIAEQMGSQEEAMAFFQEFASSLAAQSSEMIAFRSDLSYMPGGGM